MEWSGVEWSGVEWSGVEWSGVEWSGVEWSGVQLLFAVAVAVAVAVAGRSALAKAAIIVANRPAMRSVKLLRRRHRNCFWSYGFSEIFFTQDGQDLHLKSMAKLPLSAQLSSKVSNKR